MKTKIKLKNSGRIGYIDGYVSDSDGVPMAMIIVDDRVEAHYLFDFNVIKYKYG